MYIPVWLLITVVVIILFYPRKKKDLSKELNNVESIEEYIGNRKDTLFELAHFDSPHFIDYQNYFDVMEANFMRLKHRFSDDKEKLLNITKNWQSYVDALNDLKTARVLLDVDLSENAWDNASEAMKEPEIIKEEIEKKFKEMLGKDWIKLPLDYFQRQEKYPKLKEKQEKIEMSLENITEGWKIFYKDDKNFIDTTKKRQETINKKVK